MSSSPRSVSALTASPPSTPPTGQSWVTTYAVTTLLMYSATSLEDALIYETDSSAKVLTTEAIVGAKKFAAGLGKHGKFNVNQVAEKEVVEVKLFDSI